MPVVAPTEVKLPEDSDEHSVHLCADDNSQGATRRESRDERGAALALRSRNTTVTGREEDRRPTSTERHVSIAKFASADRQPMYGVTDNTSLTLQCWTLDRAR